MAGDWFVPRIANVSRGKGHAPATAKAPYRAAERILDERTGEVHDYRQKGGVEAAFLLTAEPEPRLPPSGRQPLASRSECREPPLRREPEGMRLAKAGN